MADAALAEKPVAPAPFLASLELQHEVEQFLYREAALLDERRFRDWLELLTDDISYILETNTLAQVRDRRKGVAPPTTYIFNETKYQLERRVARVESGLAWSEEPASRTRHFVSNIRILARDGDEIEVACNYLTHRAAKARDHHNFIGARVDRLRRVDGQWKICSRLLELDEFVLTAPNISILL